MSIIRITEEEHITEIEKGWTVFTDEFEAYAGQFSHFTAKNGTVFGTPEKDKDEKLQYFKEGWWSSDAEGNNRITEAYVGDTVYFNIKMENVKETDAEVNLQLYDDDGWLNPPDPIDIVQIKENGEKGDLVKSKPIVNNKVSFPLTLTDGLIDFIEDDIGNEIELYFECGYKDETKVKLPYLELDYLKVFEKEEIITVLIELPHSNYTDKLNRKGLGGHTGIIIGDEYYDFGPQPNSPYSSEGRPWWDQMSDKGNLTKKDILGILNDKLQREEWGIVGKVCLIDIHLKGSEKNKIEKWWIERYKELGTYSVFPFLGEQCTTAVRISIEKNSSVFDLYTSKIVTITKITEVTQTPEGFLNLLLESGQHTNGSKKGGGLEITKEYDEIN
ncbi:hypothetical protein [Empedobacter tilapiae]